METFKVENFKARWPDKVFPEFHSLSSQELSVLQIRLLDAVHFDRSSDLLDLVKKIQSVVSVIKGVNVENNGFSLLELLSNLGIMADKSIYLNWHRYDDVDKMNLCDLDKYFSDIWYPSSDDIDIFDESCSWVLSVRHDGVPSVAKNVGARV